MMDVSFFSCGMGGMLSSDLSFCCSCCFPKVHPLDQGRRRPLVSQARGRAEHEDGEFARLLSRAIFFLSRACFQTKTVAHVNFSKRRRPDLEVIPIFFCVTFVCSPRSRLPRLLRARCPQAMEMSCRGCFHCQQRTGSGPTRT